MSAVINGIGSGATLLTFLIVLVTKFPEGAWLVVIVAPLLWVFMIFVKRHYRRIEEVTAVSDPSKLSLPKPAIAVLPIEHWDSVSQKALQLAYAFSNEIHVLHIRDETEEDDFEKKWKQRIACPISEPWLKSPELVILRSPYRKVISPILHYVERISNEKTDSLIVVFVPELIESHWYHSFLHNQRAKILKALLLRKSNERVVIVNVPWRLEHRARHRDSDRVDFPRNMVRRGGAATGRL